MVLALIPLAVFGAVIVAVAAGVVAVCFGVVAAWAWMAFLYALKLVGDVWRALKELGWDLVKWAP